MMKSIYNFLFKIFGWKVVGTKPSQYKKFIIVVAPHTSNVDFLLGVAARGITELNSAYLGKKELFDLPLIGWFFKAMGGIPVDRSKKTNLVDQVVEYIESSDPKTEVAVCITPEGTRTYVDKWKTGFWHIAETAGIPIVMVGFDYRTKTVEFKEPFFVSEKEADIEMMKAYFRTQQGKYPEHGVR
ncbi:MAG: 1-acyl-sn-glycerol-3-phosphate acyltransferase [Bacteroidota bacterium]